MPARRESCQVSTWNISLERNCVATMNICSFPLVWSRRGEEKCGNASCFFPRQEITQFEEWAGSFPNCFTLLPDWSVAGEWSSGERSGCPRSGKAQGAFFLPPLKWEEWNSKCSPSIPQTGITPMSGRC